MKKKLLSVLGLILIFSIMLSYVANLVKWKHSGNEYRIFYEKSSDFDVLFFGASVVHYSIYLNRYRIIQYKGRFSNSDIMVVYTVSLRYNKMLQAHGNVLLRKRIDFEQRQKTIFIEYC